MGLLDYFRTVHIEYRDDAGKLVKKRVSKREFDKLIQPAIARGEATVKDACTVHFLDPKGNRSEIWPIGDEGVPAHVHERFKDAKGDVYALVVHKNGEPETSFIKEEIWKQAEQQFAEAERDSANNVREALKGFEI